MQEIWNEVIISHISAQYSATVFFLLIRYSMCAVMRDVSYCKQWVK